MSPPSGHAKKNPATSSSSSSCESDSSDSEAENVTKSSTSSGVCDQCGKVGVRKFSLKELRFCSVSCLKIAKDSGVGDSKTSKPSGSQPSSPGPSTSGSNLISKRAKPDTGSFDWKTYLNDPSFCAAPVSCFKHVAFTDCWSNIVIGMKVEVINRDNKNYTGILPTFYWVASVVKNAGYMSLLRYEGFDNDSSMDFWVNMCTDDIHAVGWCSTEGKPLIPPKSIEEKFLDWKQFLMKRLIGTKTLPSDFTLKVDESLTNNIQKGMKLEVVDKNRISSVRVATVSSVIGGRLHVTYEGWENGDEGFWCHERSPLIHPVGWAQVIGHDLKATTDYAKQSLHKTLFREFEPNDATWDMFLPVSNPVNDLKFKAGMKLEAIDPLNLSAICVATVTKVLRNNYLMIGIDGMMAANGSDWFCYHASSPCIFPVGFCRDHNIRLTPPRGYKGEFKWDEYLKQTKSEAAPFALFQKDIPNHGFEEGMHLEAVDLMEPRLICVGCVKKVVGRLLRIHFDGWDDAYDQWCDCESPDLFPVGWCQMVGYRLEAPRSRTAEDSVKKKKKFNMYKGQRRKKRSGRKSMHRLTNTSLDKQKDTSDASSDTSPKSQAGLHGSENVQVDEQKSGNSSLIAGKSGNGDVPETDPQKWNVDEVSHFLKTNDCGTYSQIFTQEKIDGPKFLSLTKESLMSITGMKVGPSLKISHLIQQLKLIKK